MGKISESMFNSLNTGNAELRLLEYNPKTGADLSSLDFSQAHVLLTLENSFQIQKDTPSFTSTRLDQKHKVIESGVTPGENYTMQGNIPYTDYEFLAEVFEKGSATAVSVSVGDKTYKASGAVKLGGKEMEFIVLAIAQTESEGQVFAHVKFIFSEPQHDDNTTPTYVHFDAAVLPNRHASGDFTTVTLDTTSDSGSGN